MPNCMSACTLVPHLQSSLLLNVLLPSLLPNGMWCSCQSDLHAIYFRFHTYPWCNNHATRDRYLAKMPQKNASSNVHCLLMTAKWIIQWKSNFHVPYRGQNCHYSIKFPPCTSLCTLNSSKNTTHIWKQKHYNGTTVHACGRYVVYMNPVNMRWFMQCAMAWVHK